MMRRSTTAHRRRDDLADRARRRGRDGVAVTKVPPERAAATSRATSGALAAGHTTG